jgi:ABC-type Na+ efflux pump permease subunit
MAKIRLGPTALSGGRPNRQSSRAMHLDMLIGFIAFFTVVSFAVTVSAELSGEDAVLEALILLGLVLALVGLFRLRRRVNV